MKKLIFIMVFMVVTSYSVFAQEAVDLEAKATNYRAAVKELGGTLKAKLVEAIKSGGPIAALEVCHTKAAEIAQSASEKLGFSIGRVSLKNRNQHNVPDAWEKTVLDSFAKRVAQGEDKTKMEHYELLEQDGQKVVRYMKAVFVESGCLTCHGEKIPKPIQTELNKLYPDDKAVNYKEGDLRGAFTVKEILK
jgi:hypothetical protein